MNNARTGGTDCFIFTLARWFIRFLLLFFSFFQKRAKYFTFTRERERERERFIRLCPHERIKTFGTSVISKSRIYVFECGSLLFVCRLGFLLWIVQIQISRCGDIAALVSLRECKLQNVVTLEFVTVPGIIPREFIKMKSLLNHDILISSCNQQTNMKILSIANDNETLAIFFSSRN